MLIFLSTPSARRATFRRPERGCSCAISIHALREEGDARFEFTCPDCKISIHALREEGDRQRPRARRALRKISIHALREEGDHLRSASTTM